VVEPIRRDVPDMDLEWSKRRRNPPVWEDMGVDQWRMTLAHGMYYVHVGRDLASSIPNNWEYEVRDHEHGLELVGWADGPDEAKRKGMAVGLSLVAEIQRRERRDVQK